MGRETKQTVKLPFNGRALKLYRPTDAQATILVVVAKKAGTDGTQTVIRLMQVIEALVVESKDWEWIEDLMISGSIEMSAFSKLIEDLFTYEWPEISADDE